MAISYPYSLSYLADTLCITDVIWDIQRNDELSGTGDGRVWQTELAPPLWIASVSIAPAYHNDLKQTSAKIRKLYGSQEAFYLYDPTSRFPQYDPTGSILGTNVVTVSGINTARNAIALSGLPTNYVVTIGDKVQINYGTGRTAFLEISETVTASELGNSPLVEVFPNVPPGITTGSVAILANPACKMIMMPNSHSPGTSVYAITSGSTFKAIQKK